MRRALAPLILGTAVAGGCSLFTSLGDFASVDPAEGTDASMDSRAPGSGADANADERLDGGAGADVVEASADALSDADAGLANIHPHGTFEPQSCAPWGNYLADLDPSGTARSGTGACRVCGKGNDTDFSIDDEGAIDAPPIGAEYRAEAWVRSTTSDQVPATSAIILRTINVSPSYAELDKAIGGGLAPTATWALLSATLVITKPSQKLNVVVTAKYSAGACFIVDDVAVYRTK